MGKGKKKKNKTQIEDASTSKASSEQLQEESASKEEAASTSKATSSEQLQERSTSQKKKQVAQSLPQKQQVPPGPPQQSQSQPQQQGAWGQPRQGPLLQQQQQAGGQPQQGPPPQQQGAWGQPRQGPPPQQQGAWGQPQQGPLPQQQQQGAWGQPRQGPPPKQQQWAGGQPQQGPLPQQQGAWGQPRRGPPPQQQGAWGQPRQGPPSQQQGAWGQPQQGPPPQQQQQGAWGQPRQGPPPQQQGAWGQPQQGPLPQQQGAWGQPRRGPPPQQQGAWGQPRQGPPPQQQGAWGQPQQGPLPQQQQQGAWGQPRQGPLAQQQQWAGGQPQQGPPPQQQQQGVWGQPRQGPPPQQQQWAEGQPQQGPLPQQQGAWGQPRQGPPAQQQQQQKAWGQPQQGPSPQQQQGAWGQPRQQQSSSLVQQQSEARNVQQQVPFEIGAGDAKLITDKSKMHSDIQQKQATSAESEFSQLSLRDPLQSTKTSQKGKMTSSAMKQYQLAIPKRKNPMSAGTKGIPIRVYTNMFQIIFNKDFVTNAVHYDVNISPTASKTLHREIFEQCRANNFNNRYPAFDGKKNAYSANNLPFNDFMETDILIFNRENEQAKSKSFKISLKKVANIDLSWIKNLRPGLDEADRDQTGIQVLDIIMRHAPESRFLSVGKSLFWDINESELLGGGLSLSRGGFTSAVLGWQPYINIDVAHKGFPTCQNVVNLMLELTNTQHVNDLTSAINNPRNREKIEKFLKGLKVIYQIPSQQGSKDYTKRTYRVNGLGPKANEHTFDCAKQDKKEEDIRTIEGYFAGLKKYKLRHPYLPCLWVGATSRDEKIYLPAELCTIMRGQSVNRKLDDIQTSNMIKYAATSAPTRKERIQQAFGMINVNNSPTMQQEFHLSVSSQMKQVDARILPAPVLQYNERTARVNRGIWQMQAFQIASNLEKDSWTIFNLSGMVLQEHLIPEFVSSLKQCAKEVGMFIGDPQAPYKSLKPHNTAEITEYFRSKKGLKLIIVIISDYTDTTYGKVKQITELSLGILTQCIKLKTLRRNNYATTKNILLKINSKLNGVNHTLTSQSIPQCLKNNDCMLVGADVTHPSPDAINIPSIAAVAASSNNSAFQYNIALRLQQPKEEMIIDLEEIIISQLNIYRSKMSRLPNKIIYYRDGVSEGQLAQVMYFEINAIKRACTRCKASNIQITCLVVQKRHHVRLFPTSDKDSDDKNKNVKAGTIVDTEITHPNHIDFYLVSHASIQGTARPTKYRCICNESNYTEDNIEELTYYLCHMYARCTRAVSYPAPTYYAHLGAYRGRALIQGINIRLDNLDAEQNKLCMKMDASPMCFV